MWNKLNTFLNCLIGAFIGVFLARSVYTYWDYTTHPEIYAVSSAPWYTAILLFGIVSGAIILAYDACGRPRLGKVKRRNENSIN